MAEWEFLSDSRKVSHHFAFEIHQKNSFLDCVLFDNFWE